MYIQTGDPLGQYIVETPLSEAGGTARLFLAHDAERPSHKAVLKVQLADDENSVIYQNLLDQEAKVLRQLRHPGIVRIYPLHIDGRTTFTARAFNISEEPWYFAIEYLYYNTLDHYIGEIRDYPLDWSLELFYQLITIVDYMHLKGFAHCDLKPQNIFLRYPPEPRLPPMPVLVDFGSAVKISKGISQLTASLRYSPPEVLLALERQDLELSHIRPDKVDIWALGAILFEILTTRPMVSARRRRVITTTVIRGEFDRISQKRREQHPALHSLDKVVSRMVDSNPMNRPPTGQLIQAIEERIPSIRPPRIPLG